ncbi:MULTISPECIES: GGDEF domain-containing protein [unclassified Paenibacillus]|uniref:GGDEF domain-containing protein n=1 Tax=unclassified Paenibacillus TaxID=185978 RepID=UPI0006CF23DD|nr:MULTISPECIES: GGDEF domain-containing protein [unclassified Paenibacillus]
MNKLNLCFMLSFVILSFLLAASYLTKPELIFMAGSLLIIGLINVIFRPMAGFAALIAYDLGLAFYNIAANWGKTVDVWFQGEKLVVQLIYSLGATAVWLLIYHINQLRERLLALQKEVESLRKLEPVTGVLTFAEFMERAKLLFSGMKRRKETGYYIICELHMDSKDPQYKKRVVYEKMMAKLLDSTRKNYDLVGNYGGHRAIILLTNTNQSGVEVVLDRFYKKIAEDRSLKPELFDITVNELAIDEWEQFEKVISPLRGGKAA